MQRKALGKGLEALLKTTTERDGTQDKTCVRRIITIPINDITPNRNQPRKQFSSEAMEELKKSIAENGILEPPIVRRNGEFYELIAGERRYRAAKELNFDTIDVILTEVDSDVKMLVLSLVENLQREDLNAIEEARAYQEVMDSMEITQEELSEIIGKSRSAIANTIRLLTLSEQIQNMIIDGTLAPGSARALVTVDDKDIQYKLARKIASEGLSAREAEQLVKTTLLRKTHTISEKEVSPFLEACREDLQRTFGTVVKIKGNEVKGKIEIAYYTQDDLERILEILKGEPLE